MDDTERRALDHLRDYIDDVHERVEQQVEGVGIPLDVMAKAMAQELGIDYDDPRCRGLLYGALEYNGERGWQEVMAAGKK